MFALIIKALFFSLELVMIDVLLAKLMAKMDWHNIVHRNVPLCCCTIISSIIYC